MSANWADETMEERMYALGVWLLAKEIDPWSATDEELGKYAARFGIDSIQDIWDFLDELDEEEL